MNAANTPVSVQAFLEYYHYQHPSDYVFEGHIHSKWEINVLTRGEMEITYDDHIIHLQKDMLLIGEPGAYHRSRVLSGDGAALTVYQFFTDSIPRTGQPRLYHMDRYDQSLFYLLECECEREGCHKTTDCCVQKELNWQSYRLLELLLSKLTRNESLSPNVTHAHAQLFHEAIQHMESRLHTSLTLPEIAEACQTSPSQLERIFAAYTGSGAMAHFAQMKLARAKEALKQGKSVRSVSEMLGFSSQAYFSLWFKKAAGLPPKRYAQRG